MKSKFHTKQKFLQFEWISKGREKMYKLKSGISLVMILMASSGLIAQFAGWPAGEFVSEVDYSGTTAINSEVFMDDNRARVTAATLHSSSPLQYDLTITPPTGVALSALNFPADKWCLLIQMEDHTSTNVGNHTRVNVVSYNSGTGVLRVEAPNGWPNFSLGTNDRVQIIRVPIYWNLDLDPEGIMTCAPYNHSDGTGGIVPFVVANNLEFNGGIISAASKGYHYGWATTPQLGQGGAGNSAPAYTGLGGGTAGGPYAGPVEEFYYLPDNGIPPFPPGAGTEPPITINDNHLHGYLCSDVLGRSEFDFNASDLINATTITIFNGNNGDVADNSFLTPGTSTAFGSLIHYNPSAPTKSFPWVTLRMGNSGNPGADGGQGGGGGGFGGTGGFNSSINFPIGGVTGWGGQSGGNVGEGGRGGGIVLVKVNTYSINVASGAKMIFADGQNGQHGRPGGNGGKGGAGGLGASGDCFGGQIVPPGGVGGFGESGIGAGGGDGGNGGDCGTIWIMRKSIGMASLSSHVSIKGGRRGGAGMGGYSTKWLTLPLANNYEHLGSTGDISVLPCNPKDWHFCPHLNRSIP
jgi:hypothetical protein